MNLKEVKKAWQFSPIPNIEESTFNKTLERFFDMGVNGLTRENIQNSLDGRAPDYNGPVVVNIKTGDIHSGDIPGINEVKDRIRQLEGRNPYTKEKISHMENMLNQEKVRYISFEDINTKGLTGARNGQSNASTDTWGIYAYNKGVHFEEEDDEMETSRGGSHGVGKIASNASSDLNLMFFANCDLYGDQHLGGTVQLVEHVYEGQAYRSTGYFTDVAYLNDGHQKFYPYENTFHEVFKKDTRGLKIIIPYFREEYDDEKSIIKSICDSFFVSILQGKLEVHVNEKHVSKDTISDYVKSEDYYNQQIEKMKNEFTPLYIDTYQKQEPIKIRVSNIDTTFEFDFYFTYDENISKGRTAVVRTIGMKIEDFKVSGYATKPFNAVLIGGPKEDAYLKSLENESHTKLSKDHFNDPKLKQNATRFINNLSREIKKVVDEAIREYNPADAKIDTGDILYVVENRFKQDLEKSMGSVKISKGKTLTKSSGRPNKKEKRDKKGEKVSVTPNSPPKRKRDPVKVQHGDSVSDDNKEQGKKRYSTHSEMIERVILHDQEFIKFDFRGSKLLKDIKKCDISLSVMDGMGEEYDNEFKIPANYITVKDINTGGSCTLQKDLIKDVSIRDGIAQLQLKLKETFNRSLKFVYYVEV